MNSLKIRIVVSWVMMLCSLVGGYHHFRGTYLLYLQVLTQKTTTVFTVVKTSNLTYPDKIYNLCEKFLGKFTSLWNAY
jgi:hypothetical protein